MTNQKSKKQQSLDAANLNARSLKKQSQFCTEFNLFERLIKLPHDLSTKEFKK